MMLFELLQFVAHSVRGRHREHAPAGRGERRRVGVRGRRVRLLRVRALARALRHVHPTRRDIRRRARALRAALGGDHGRVRGGRGRELSARELAATPAQPRLGR